MADSVLASGMTAHNMVELARRHTLFEWSAQGTVDPIPVSGAKGSYFWTPDGRRFLDFNSQLMCVNIGHDDERVVQAIQRQAAVLPSASPVMATEPRARLGAKLAEVTPGDINVFFLEVTSANNSVCPITCLLLASQRMARAGT